jgi:signal transduction histidine kinase/CheY-like chemotaxis protein
MANVIEKIKDKWKKSAHGIFLRNKTLLRTSLLLCAVLIVGFVFTAFLSIGLSIELIEQDIDQIANLTADNIYQQGNTYFSGAATIALTMANDILLKEFLAEEPETIDGKYQDTEYSFQKTLQEYLNTYKEHYGFASAFLVSTKTSRYYHFSGQNRTLERDAAENAWYYEFLKSDEEYSVDMGRDVYEGSMYFVDCKIYDSVNGDIMGVIGVGFRTDDIYMMVDESNTGDSGYETHAEIIDSNSAVTMTDEELSERFKAFKSIDRSTLQSIFAEQGDWFRNPYYTGQQREDYYDDCLVIAKYISEIKSYLIVEIDASQGVEKVNHRIATTFGITILIILIILFIFNKVIKSYNGHLIKELTRDIEDKSTQLEAALEDAQEANKAKSNFLAQMSHEIRTPLNAVVGLSELALDNEDVQPESDTGEKLEKIHSSGMTILSIVNDILDMSKIESGKFEIYPVKYCTPSLINDSAVLNMVRIREKPITFKLDVDENLPETLFGDDLRVKQIFNNIRSNAFKYTNSGTVEWRVGFERDGRDVWLVSRIQDSGIGMKKESIQKLFSEYNQVDAASTRKIEGTGLGLAITKRLVEMMGGSISVESEYGKGTTFHIRIKQTFVSETPIGKIVAENLKSMRHKIVGHNHDTAAKFSHINLSYASILVVDDNSTNLDVAKGMLKPYQMKIDCASSGKQAIEMIKAESPCYSAIFMDHMMPEMDGIEAVRIIRETIDTDYARNIPIIALTANAIVGNEEMFLNAGFQDFISKPIDTAKLDTVLRRWVRDNSKESEKSAEPKPEIAEENSEMSLSPSLNINGMNTEKALERFGGDQSILIDVLRSYAADTRKILDNLNDFLTKDDVKEYAIAVHGIKGSSYAIFAQHIGNMAAELEKAAKAENIDAVKTNHPAFAEALTLFLNEMDTALKTINNDTDKALAAAPDPMLLAELQNACKSFDMDGVDAIMEQLEAFRYENGGDFIAHLRELVNETALKEIAKMEIPDFRKELVTPEKPQSKAAANDFGFTAPNAKILVAEDNETNLKAVLGQLAPFGMSIDTAANGEEALRAIQKTSYHLVLMDHLMPVMDGIEAVTQLRQMNGEYYQDLPIIAMTANGESGAKEEYLKAGMNDFITKPFERTEIGNMIKRWLPGDLIAEQEQAQQNEQEADSSPTDLPQIEGIDVAQGIRYSGSKEIFINLLENFHTLIDLKAAKIEQYLADGMTKNVTTEVHALKSAARTIGAQTLSEDFARLEQYGRDGNTQAMERETPAVLEQYRNIKLILAPFGERAANDKKPASKEELISLLKNIESAMENFDLDSADEAMAKLETVKMPEKCRTQQETLRAYVADVAMEETIKLAKEMISIIEKLPENKV